jgi:hypothetical protein
MRCTTCPECWPGILDGDGLCPSCACLQCAPEHRVGTCPICGQFGVPLEVHHPGLKKHWPTVTIPICLSCHRILTNRTVSDWSSLSASGHKVRCLLQGLADLCWLWTVRSASAPELARLVRMAAVALFLHFGFVPFRRRP